MIPIIDTSQHFSTVRWSEDMAESNSAKRPTQHQGDLILAELVQLKVNQSRALFQIGQLRMLCYTLALCSVTLIVMVCMLGKLIFEAGAK